MSHINTYPANTSAIDTPPDYLSQWNRSCIFVFLASFDIYHSMTVVAIEDNIGSQQAKMRDEPFKIKQTDV